MTITKLLPIFFCILFVAACTSTSSQNKSTSATNEAEADEGDDEDFDAEETEETADGAEEDGDLSEKEVAEGLSGKEDGGDSGSSGQSGGSGSGPVDVTDLRYISSRNGGTVVIRTSGPASYRIREEKEKKQMIVELADASLPDRLKRPYPTSEFNQSILAINAYQVPDATTARFVVQMRDNERLKIEQNGNELFLAPSSESSEGSIAVNDEAEGESSGDANTDKDTGKNIDGSNSKGDPASAKSGAPRDGLPMSGASLESLNYNNLRFYGRPISIEVRDSSIRDVIAFIADQSGANLVVAEDVKGTITLKLKQVPWDQALLLVMKSKQLGYVRQGNVLRIAPLDALQTETETARKVVEAQRAAEPLRVRVVPVSYGKVEDMAKQVQAFLSPRGRVVEDGRTSSLIITDIIENIERTTNLVKALDIPPLQVQIEAKVIEAREGFTRQIGVRWGAPGNVVELGPDLNLTPSISVGPSGVAAEGATIGLNLGTLDILGNLDAQLGLFESEDQVKVISAPRVVTMNNEPANINQITQIPITNTTVNDTGTRSTSTSFKDITLALDVTPQITSDSDVIMKVEIKREFIGVLPIGGSAPPVFTRSAKTRVMVQNGQTAVIGGIYQSDISEGTNGVPWLRHIPIVGWLFKQKRYDENKNELLLFLTPRILNSTEGTIKSEEL